MENKIKEILAEALAVKDIVKDFKKGDTTGLLDIFSNLSNLPKRIESIADEMDEEERKKIQPFLDDLKAKTKHINLETILDASNSK
jgi:hypothetical protein